MFCRAMDNLGEVDDKYNTLVYLRRELWIIADERLNQRLTISPSTYDFNHINLVC